MTPKGCVGLSEITVTAGSENQPDADIAVIVMAINGDRRALEAVTSVMGQGIRVEIVLVNTGAPSLGPVLPMNLARRITFVETRIRRFPGGARNLGIAHSSAPIVAFLAADCIATPAWLSRRLRAHDIGYDLVASALRPKVGPRGRIPSASWACYVLTHLHRAPCTEHAAGSVLFGLSYRRSIFDRYGLFNETVRVSEDMEFNRLLLDSGQRALWNPEILAWHAYPDGLFAAVIDQFGRGRRSALHAADHACVGPLGHFRACWRRNRTRAAIARASRSDLDFDHRRVVNSMLLLLRGAHALGVLSAAPTYRRVKPVGSSAPAIAAERSS